MLLALLFFVQSSIAQDLTTAVEYYESAQTEFDTGNFAQAAELLQKSITEDPESVSARLLLGETYLRLGDGAEAEQVLTMAEDLGAHPRLTAVSLAQAYFLQGKLDALLARFFPVGHESSAVQLQILMVRGYAAFRLGDLGGAVSEFEQANRLAPHMAAPLLGMARVQAVAGDYSAADQTLETAIERAPEDPEIWYLKGYIERTLGRSEQALPYFGRAHQLAPGYLSPLIGQVSALIEIGRYKDARRQLNVLLATESHDLEVLYLRALLLAEEGNLEAADQALRTAVGAIESKQVGEYGEFSEVLFLKGLVEFALGRYELAEVSLRDFARMRSTHVPAQKALAQTLIRLARDAQALEVLERVLELTPNDVPVRLLHGHAMLQLGHYEAVLPELVSTVELESGNNPARIQLALAQLGMGNVHAAVGNLEQVLRYDPRDVRASIMLGYLYVSLREFDTLLALAKHLDRVVPDDIAVQSLLGSAHYGLGDTESAYATFHTMLERNPSFAPAQVALGLVSLDTEQLDSAGDHFRAALGIEASNVVAMRGLARVEELQGNLEGAVEWIKEIRDAVGADESDELAYVASLMRADQDAEALAVANSLHRQRPDDLDVLLALGQAEIANGRLDLARATLSNLMRLSGYSQEWLYRIAQHQLEAQDFAGARWSLLYVVREQPEFSPAYITLAFLELAAGEFETAVEIGKQLQTRYPAHPIGDLVLGDLYVAAGDYATALEYYKAGSSKKPISEAAIRESQALVRMDETGAAIEHLQNWLVHNPQDTAAQRVLGSIYLKNGNLTKARAVHEGLLAELPADGGLLNNLAWIYYLQRDPRALSYAQRAENLLPRNPAVLDTLGWMLVESGEHSLGLRYLREASARSISEPRISYHIAMALERQGSHDAARRELERALEAGESFPEIEDARSLFDELGGPLDEQLSPAADWLFDTTRNADP